MKAILKGNFEDEDPDGVIYILPDIDFVEYEKRANAYFEYAKEVYSKFSAGLDVSSNGWSRIRAELRNKWRDDVRSFVEEKGYKIEDWVRL